jgi:hypothetical protein
MNYKHKGSHEKMGKKVKIAKLPIVISLDCLKALCYIVGAL